MRPQFVFLKKLTFLLMFVDLSCSVQLLTLMCWFGGFRYGGEEPADFSRFIDAIQSRILLLRGRNFVQRAKLFIASSLKMRLYVGGRKLHVVSGCRAVSNLLY